MWFANIFCHPKFTFSLSWCFPGLSRCFLVDTVSLVYFCFGCFAFGVKSKKLSPRPMSRSLPVMFSSKNFVVSSLTFKSLIHFELIFVYGVRKGSNFIFLLVAVQISQLPHCIQRIYNFPLLKINWPYMHGFISGLSILFHLSIYLSSHQYHIVLITVRKGTVLVAQSHLTLCDSMDCSPSGSSAHGILQARILEWVALPSPGIFLTQEASPYLSHCRQILYHLSHQGSP